MLSSSNRAEECRVESNRETWVWWTTISQSASFLCKAYKKVKSIWNICTKKSCPFIHVLYVENIIHLVADDNVHSCFLGRIVKSCPMSNVLHMKIQEGFFSASSSYSSHQKNRRILKGKQAAGEEKWILALY